MDSIDDNLKERGVSVVKTSSQDQIQSYDIEVIPKLIYFEAEIPTFWPDETGLEDNATILAWIEQCQDSDLIEEITAEMMEKLIANTDQIAVFFYDKKSVGSYEAILDGLENIDDELDTFELPFVKISSRSIAAALSPFIAASAATVRPERDLARPSCSSRAMSASIFFVTASAQAASPAAEKASAA